jgi:hypothetical protein
MTTPEWIKARAVVVDGDDAVDVTPQLEDKTRGLPTRPSLLFEASSLAQWRAGPARLNATVPLPSPCGYGTKVNKPENDDPRSSIRLRTRAMCGPSPYNPIVSASGALLRDVLVGVVGHQQGGDDADYSAQSDVAGNDVARCGYCPVQASNAVAMSGAGPPAVIEAS